MCHILGMELVKISKKYMPLKLSVKQNEYVLEVSLRMCNFLKLPSRNCSLLRYVNRKIPNRKPMASDDMNWKKADSVNMPRAKAGRGLEQWMTWAFSHQSWDAIILAASVCLLPSTIHSLLLPLVWTGTVSYFSLFFLVSVPTQGNSWTFWVLSKDSRCNNDGFYNFWRIFNAFAHTGSNLLKTKKNG